MDGRPTAPTVSREQAAGPVKAAPRGRLIVVHPTGLEASIALGEDALVLGRDATGEARLAHATVSRRHFEVAWDPRRRAHVGRDLGSHNGSTVDGIAASEAVLREGTVLRLGDVLLVCDAEPPGGDEGGVSLEAIPGRAAAASRLRASVARAAPDLAPALILGETGTGKELVARETHRLSGRKGTFVAVNCAALSAELVESQLFGHVRGAFTGATEARPGLFRTAQEGTLFLDEVGELPLGMQAKLLRAVQEREIRPVGSTSTMAADVRVIAATNRELTAAVEAGLFRRDLYARLSLWEIRVPSLRERRADLFAWVERLERRWAAERGTAPQPPAFTADAAEALLLHAWPENLRGVERLVRELSGRDRTSPIGCQDLPAWCAPRQAAGSAAEPTPGRSTAIPGREEFTAIYRDLAGNVSAIARHFGRDRRQIYRWIAAYGLGAPTGRS